MDQPRLRPVDRSRSNNRVVERHGSAGIEVLWFPPTKTMLGVRPKKATAHIVDLSVGGVLLRGPANRHATVGALVELSLDGAPGVVRVCHVSPATPDGKDAHYGVQFVQLRAPLKDRIFALVESQREDAARLESIWNTAR